MKNELNELLNKKIDNDIYYQLNEEQLNNLGCFALGKVKTIKSRQ